MGLGVPAWMAVVCLLGAEPPAADLMRRGLYNDAVRMLLGEIEVRREEECGQRFLMLGESLYMLGQHAEARPYLAKARKHLRDAESLRIADYRLACVAYRMGDPAGALDGIDAFVSANPTDRRSGTLLFFRMNLLARRGPPAQAEIEATHKRIQDNLRTFGHAVGVAADKVLTDFYVENGQEEKARQRYESTVHNFRNAIAQYASEKRPVPASLEEAHDRAAFELGAIALKAKRLDDAVRWLENVRYDATRIREARLLLAQVAYQRRDMDRAIGLLARDGFIETVPPGSLRSDMYLLLGLAEKGRANPDPAKVEEHLKKVEPGASGYFQAQAVLGDLYRERGLIDLAIRAFENAAPSPSYEAQVLLQLGRLYVEKAGAEKDAAAAEALYRKAAKSFSELSAKFPASALAKEASEAIDLLLSKGFAVDAAVGDEAMIKRWEEAIRTRPGSVEAARSLINLARLHHKAVFDEKGTALLKAPNHAACARACDRLLDETAYKGDGFPPETWGEIRVEALYFRGASHLASATKPAREAAGPISPAYIEKPDLAQAIRDLTAARERVDPKRLDLVKNIEIALVEAMLKSDSQEMQEKGRARFAELSDEYGSEARFQQLAIDLAEWYRSQGRSADAAREYRGIAERGGELDIRMRLEALLAAGKLFSTAAREAAGGRGERHCAVLIQPKEVFRLPDFLKTHTPFGRRIRVAWPEGKSEVSAAEALAIVSRASGIPFVWSPEGGKDTLSEYLASRTVRFERLEDTVERFLRQILDIEHHRLTPDIGITGGKPTIETRRGSEDDPDRIDASVPIEIYDQMRWDRRFPPLAQDYGSWRDVHGGGGGRAMLYAVVRRIEERSKTKVLWADGVDREEALAAEYEAVPGIPSDRSATCAETLARLLEPLDLRFEIVARDRGADLYDEAKECFRRIRQLDPRSTYGEKALFLLALNFYQQEEYERMKLVLKEYLKLFDSPRNEYFHQACFWVGWVLEREGRYREACQYYGRAAEEVVVLLRPAAGAPPLPRAERKAQLGYETRLALEEPVDGYIEDYALDREFLEFIRLNANVAVRLDASAAGTGASIRHGPFKGKPVIDILCETLDGLGLDFRVENVKPEEAERAYYRMASACEKDGVLEEALANIHILLARFPETTRKRDAYKLKLEIHKGLKDYRSVLATLDAFARELSDEFAPYQIEFEKAWIYFDLCRYADAADHFRQALAAAKDPRERLNIRDGYARALFRNGDLAAALDQYRALAKEEPDPLRAFIDAQMVWYLESATGGTKAPPLPPAAAEFIEWYEGLGEAERNRLPADPLAKATWIYYTAALVDLAAGEVDRAIQKLTAAANSPDDSLAADALYKAAVLQIESGKYAEAKESLEYLLFATRSAEAEVKATYALAVCLEKLGEPEQAKRRFDWILKMFPDSTYGDRIRARSSGNGGKL